MKKEIDLKTIRTAIADYMQSEGCGCCASPYHNEDKEKLAKLLRVPMYDDKSGYNFHKFISKKEN